MHKLLTQFSDFIFPPSPEEMLVRSVNGSILKNIYEPGIYQDTRYLCYYSEPIVQTLITENKFHHNRNAACALNNLISYWIEDQSEAILFIPIPLGRRRLRERGHNQVETILTAKPIKATVCSRILKRKKETLPQSQLPKDARERNIQAAFQFTGNDFDFSPYTQLVLVDDVVTTGSTLKAARASLAPHIPPHITFTCLAIAH